MSRVAAIAAAARARAVARLATALRAAVPDRGVVETPDGVTVAGRGVTRDPRLAWIGSLLR